MCTAHLQGNIQLVNIGNVFGIDFLVSPEPAAAAAATAAG